MYLVLFLLVVVLIIFKVRKSLLYWEDRGIAYKRPLPFLRDFLKVMLGRVSFYDSFIDLYQDFPNERYSGIHQFGSPTVIIRNVELIKQILIKDFDHFHDHRNINGMNEDLFSKNLVFLKGQEWRDMRTSLSPAFTGSKMKAMSNLIAECADNLAKYFMAKNENVIDVEMKELFSKYTNDVIATCAFGVQCDSLNNENNDFFVMGGNAMRSSALKAIKFTLFTMAPKLVKALGITMFPTRITDFFVKTVSDSIEYRTKHGIHRPDMIHLLMQARKGKLQHEETEQADKGFAVIDESNIGKQPNQTKKEITDMDIAAQAFVFFLAGFESASTLMSLMAYELALNPDVQNKLFQEISVAMEATDNKPSYEYITDMTYLDMVVSESLRKWPSGPITDRACTKDYTIKAEKPSERDFVIRKGENINIPILALHRDEKYFPSPDKFDPERFSDKNKHNILPYSYLPFGVGPRACIGNRFALLEIKVLFTYLLAKFELTIVEKSTVPFKLGPGFQIKPKNGFWLGLKTRK